MLHINNFVEILQSELDHKQKLNPSFSLRSFAKNLDIAPSKLSEVLNNKQGMSEKVALKICEKLNYSVEETEHFILTVRAKCSKSPKNKTEAIDKLNINSSQVEYLKIQEKVFSTISNWYHFALLELIDNQDFKYNLNWISKRLDITIEEAKQAIDNLHSLGLVEIKNNKIKKSGHNLVTSDGIGSSPIRKFNDQIISKAKEAIYDQSVEQRHISTLTTGINEEILPEVFEKISEFRKELNQFISTHSKSKSNNKVYCFSSQMFELTKGE